MCFRTCQVCWGCHTVLIDVKYWGMTHRSTVISSRHVSFFQKHSDLSRKLLIFLRNLTMMQIMCFRTCQVCWGCHTVLIEVKYWGTTHRSTVISSRFVLFFQKCSDLSQKWSIVLRNPTLRHIMCFITCQVCWGCRTVLIKVKYFEFR